MKNNNQKETQKFTGSGLQKIAVFIHKTKEILQKSFSLRFILVILLLIVLQNCPILERLYTLQSGNSDLITREEGQKLVRQSVIIFTTKCNTDLEKATIISTFEPMLSASPCSEGIISGKGATARICYRKLFLDRSDIQSCSLLLLASSCGENRFLELAASQKICENALSLENYSTLFSIY